MEIVKKAINSYYSENLDPNAVLAAWVLRERPPKALVEKAAKDINQSLYVKEVLYNQNLNPDIPLVNIDKITKLIDAYERANRSFETSPELDLLKTAHNINDFILAGKIELWFNKVAEEQLPEDKPNLKDQVINWLRGTYSEEFQKIKDYIVSTVMEAENVMDKIASAMVQDTLYFKVSPTSLLGILNHYISNQDLKSSIFHRYQKELSKHASIDTSELISGNRVIDVIKDLNTVHQIKSEQKKLGTLKDVSLPLIYTLYDKLNYNDAFPIIEKCAEWKQFNIMIPKSASELISYLLNIDKDVEPDYKPILDSAIALAKIKSLIWRQDEN